MLVVPWCLSVSVIIVPLQNERITLESLAALSGPPCFTLDSPPHSYLVAPNLIQSPSLPFNAMHPAEAASYAANDSADVYCNPSGTRI
jgi:hypothetical protein